MFDSVCFDQSGKQEQYFGIFSVKVSRKREKRCAVEKRRTSLRSSECSCCNVVQLFQCTKVKENATFSYFTVLFPGVI